MTSLPDWPETDAGGSLGDGRPASATYHPESVADLPAIVHHAVAAGLAVYPQGGGTALDYGGIPSRPGVIIRTGRLDRVVDYPVADMTITMEAGITLGAIREIVNRAGQRLAIESPEPDRATLGGIYATAWTGPRRFGWGRPRDQIIGVTFVTGAGEIVRGGGRVVKNVAGYDFPKLLTGSMGTLGIITELTLKVNPRPAASALLRFDQPSLAEVATTLDRLNTSGARPIALELVDGSNAGRGTDLGWALLIGLEGNEAAVAWQTQRLEAELGQPASLIRRDDEAESAWLDFVASEATAAGLFQFRASFAASNSLIFLEEVRCERWEIRVHAGNGIVRGVSRAVDQPESWAAEIERLRAAASRLGGALIVAKCPSDWKTRVGVWGDPRPDWAMAERVKQALDPGLVLNPGRFVGTI